jgi:uncharacterized delta-60 repeat protein
MRISSWLRPFAASMTRTRIRPASLRRVFRPRVETLEDRTVLAAVPPPVGLTNWWPADNSLADIAGQGAGIAIGGVGYAAGEVGQAFSFTGPGQYVAVTGSSTIQGPRTIEGWVKPDPNTDYGLPIITFGTPGAGDFFGIAGTTGTAAVGQYKLYVDHWGIAAYASTVTVTPGAWNHVALTYDGATVRFFINGQAAGQVVGSLYDYALDTATIGGNTIGGTTTKPSFSGSIDELSLYNRALSAQEILSIYQAGADGKNQFFVASSSPAAGENVTAPPTDFTVHFSFNAALVQPGDLKVNGDGANMVVPDPIDNQTVTFHYAISPVTTAGPQTMQIAMLGWSSTFYYNFAGQLDPTFGNGGLVTTEFNTSAPAAFGDETGAWGVAVQPNDGKIILVGDVGSATTGYSFAVARYNANGVLDTTFGQNGRVTLSFGSPQDGGNGVTVQPDGKILVVGTTYNSATGLDEFAVARLLPNGAFDTGFYRAGDHVGPGMVTVGFDGVDISYSNLRAQLQGNKIVVSDSRCNGSLALARLNSDGSVDNSFGTAGNGRVLIPVGGIYHGADAVVEPTGKIVIADETGRVFRLNSDGSPDNTFSNQTLDFSAGTVILDAQGNILISGRNDEETFTHQDWVVARLGADGNVDTTFGTGGEARVDFNSGHEAAGGLAVQANGKIIVIGVVWPQPGSDLHFFAADRLNADGQLDTSFGSQGSVVLPFDDTGNIAVAPDGGILISGAVYQPSTIYDFALLRLLGDPVANADAYTANQDTALTVPAAAGVLANDSDPGHAPLTASLVRGPAHAASFTLNPDGSFTYTPSAGYVGPDSFTYQSSEGIDPSNVATVSLTVQSLQAALDGLPSGGTLAVQTTTAVLAHDLIAAANALDPATTPTSTLVVDLGGQTIQDTILNVPPQVTIQFVNGTFIGGSPALVVSSGVVIVKNSVFLNATDAPTILVTGGSLILRNDTIQESTGFSDPAIEVTGGTVDLGTAADPGGNALNVNGSGEFVHNTTANLIPAAGNTFSVNGTSLAASTLSFTSLAANAPTILLNQPLTVTVRPDGSGTPTGSVDFVDLTTSTDLGSATLSGGSALLNRTALTVGNHIIQASYSGDGTFLPSLDTIAVSVQYKFSGFLAPLNANMAMALNRTVPIKFQLTDYNGKYITSLSAVQSLVVSGGTLGALRYDSTTNQFIANWQTRGVSAGTYTVSLALADGTTYTKSVTLSKNGSSAGLVVAGTDLATTAVGALLGGDVDLYVDNTNGDLTADELARIQDAVTAADAVTEPYGVAVTEVTDPTLADVTLNMDTISAVGGYAAGVLGCTTDAGQITIINGWNFYTGSDATQIGSAQYDFETVVEHELGHALGLGHSTDSSSVMYARLNTGTVNRSLTTADLNVADSDTTGACGLHAATDLTQTASVLASDSQRNPEPAYDAFFALLSNPSSASPGLPMSRIANATPDVVFANATGDFSNMLSATGRTALSASPIFAAESTDTPANQFGIGFIFTDSPGKSWEDYSAPAGPPAMQPDAGFDFIPADGLTLQC